MKTLRWATVALLLGTCYSTAFAQSNASIQQPASVRHTAYQSDAYGYALADAGTSPSNAPPAPSAAGAAAAPAAGATADSGSGSTADSGSGSTSDSDSAAAPSTDPVRLFTCKELDDMHLSIRGFFDGGYTANGDNPASRINGPVAYNDHDDEFQANQLYLIAERVTKVEDNCGYDFGGRVDLLYGTDHRFTQTVPGTSWDGDWNQGSNEYGLSIPQLYGDIAINKLIVRLGHFYAPVGYESAMGQDAPFYSRSYQFLYAEPTTFTGGQGIYAYNDNWTFLGGLDTGWNTFDSPDKTVDYFFGYNWVSKSKDTTFNQVILLGNTDFVIAGPGAANPGAVVGVSGNRFLLNSVLTQKIGCGDTKKWRYALEVNYGHDTNANGAGEANWWGFTNYLFYDANDCWTFGLRQEYFDDSNAAVVAQAGPPSAAPVGSRYNAVTLGADYKPNRNVVIRSEVRGDFAGNGQTTGLPFGDGTNNNQFLFDTDVIIKF